KEASVRGQKSKGLSREALALMMNYAWPGNVRELRNAIHFSLVTSKGGVIHPENLPIEFRQGALTSPKPGPSRKLDEAAVIHALKQSGGNKSSAARLLGVGRATLYRFLADMPRVS
ncbi:MAG TPA: helix-turn-helix domain-containing protein, partial [Syntrophobacteraceae bacterium]|nr:helix-turn-helix domain-containing protein [Syntrophobacteraceae bacterium]